jgi:phosphohistidine phosphatase
MSNGLQVEVLGGGRIKHVPSEYTIHVYGFSQAYGRANHGVTVALLQQWYPLHKISLAWDGY